jgi:heat shock protein HslJ
MKKLFILLLGLGVILAGCNSSKKASHSKVSLTGTHWQLIELLGEPMENNVDQKKELYLQLNSVDKRLTAFVGCNQIIGVYELKEGNRIGFSKIASTKKACLDMESEFVFLKMFETVDNYNLKGNMLMLNNAKKTPVAKFIAVPGK